MKKYLTLLGLFFILNTTFSQNWVSINNMSPNFSFQLPDNPNILDTLNIKYYYFKLDTVIGFQVHINDSAIFANNNDIFNEALTQTSGDTLRAISKIMIAFSNAELTSIQDVNISSIYKGLEVGIKYNELVSDRVAYSFIRIFRNDTNFITFTITGYDDDLGRLIDNKTLFFNSITF